MTLLESHQVTRLVVGDVVDPAAIQDADPLEGERPERCLMASPASAAALVESFRPERAEDGLANQLDEGLTEELGAEEAPVDPTFVAAALGDGRDADVLLYGGGVREALAALAEGSEQPPGGWRSSLATAPGLGPPRPRPRWFPRVRPCLQIGYPCSCDRLLSRVALRLLPSARNVTYDLVNSSRSFHTDWAGVDRCRDRGGTSGAMRRCRCWLRELSFARGHRASDTSARFRRTDT